MLTQLWREPLLLCSQGGQASGCWCQSLPGWKLLCVFPAGTQLKAISPVHTAMWSGHKCKQVVEIRLVPDSTGSVPSQGTHSSSVKMQRGACEERLRESTSGPGVTLFWPGSGVCVGWELEVSLPRVDLPPYLISPNALSWNHVAHLWWYVKMDPN